MMNSQQRNENFEILYMNFLAAEYSFKENISDSMNSFYYAKGKLEGFCMAYEIGYRTTTTPSHINVEIIKGVGTKARIVHKYEIEKAEGSGDE
ncbi:hypothetical protein [Lactococcus protaetiae]|uniref:Uncharacterized protein n=1 Tax=Lactococcus protaetiae TaxID=2592653 RepID=A0A514ZA76_9LACT|nr:hypothetical protein [Lactococcus protaetiae]QDK71481.1 hypothetical protein FLP15_10295 [Lactococcus protaetiae]